MIPPDGDRADRSGGAAGVLARHGISTLFHGDALPWATVAINVVGSFLLGVLVVVPQWFSEEVRTALGVGFLGGFTTFSVQALLDFEAGEPGRAFAYVAASVGLGLGAPALGYHAARAVLH